MKPFTTPRFNLKVFLGLKKNKGDLKEFVKINLIKLKCYNNPLISPLEIEVKDAILNWGKWTLLVFSGV